jgi:hypothetical protein
MVGSQPFPSMGIIDVVNFSNVSDDQVKKWMDSVKIQCDRDFAPLWGNTIDFSYILSGSSPKANHWHCGIFDKDFITVIKQQL